MPKLTSEIKHNLEQSEAMQRLKDSCEWAHSVSDLRETWTGNTLEFNASIQGIKVSGKVEVTEDSLKFTGSLPLIALPFKSWLPNILKNALKLRKPTGEIAEDLSDTPLVIYLHIPKAGGTTLGEFIYNQCRSNDTNDEGLIKNGVFFTTDGFFRKNDLGSPQIKNILQRKDLRAVIGHFTFGIHYFVERPFRYITMLRNPINRVISLYHYLKLEDQMSLEDFANACQYREIDNDQTRRIAGVNPDIGKCSEKDLAIAKENLRQHFAVVGTTERFDEMLALLKLKFNWTQQVSAYPRNVNNDKKNYAPSETAIKAIENRNLFDIELHAYANQLMGEMINRDEQFFELLQQQKDLNVEHALTKIANKA